MSTLDLNSLDREEEGLKRQEWGKLTWFRQSPGNEAELEGRKAESKKSAVPLIKLN